jgi:hypothetical protein
MPSATMMASLRRRVNTSTWRFLAQNKGAISNRSGYRLFEGISW